MARPGVKRKLTTILAADVEGYTRLMRADEEATLKTLGEYREIFDKLIARHDGRVFSTGGDSVLAEFASAVEAVRCASSCQRKFSSRNAELTDDRKLKFRIGINIGDVMVKDNDLFGDGVNVAARLESLAEPGGVCISAGVFQQIEHKLSLGFEDMGKQRVKNIAEPISAYRLLPDQVPVSAGAALGPRPGGAKRWAMAVVVLVALAAGGLAVWLPRTPAVEAASVELMAHPLPDKPSLAVLPFANLSDDKSDEYFADGITEDIITDISKVSGIFVIAQGSSFAYKGNRVKARQVAEDLGVRYVLSGSVRRAGSQLRITAQLADAIRGAQIWAERYDRELEDVFAVQSEITGQVVKAMAVTLKASENDRLFQKYVTNIDAYDTFLRARKTVDAPTRENIENGEILFERTIELDPDFAGGYAGLSFNYSVKARFRFGDSPGEDALRSLELAQKAIQTDKDFAWSHIALAGAYLANGRHDDAVDSVRQAIVIQPSGYEANLFMGFYLNFAGHAAAAVEFLEIANDLSRVDTIRGLDFLGMAYFTEGRYAKCEETWTRRFESLGIPDYPIGHVFLAAAQASMDRMDEAAATVERFRRSSPDFRMSEWLWIDNYKLPEDRKRLYDAAIKAGIPE